DPNSADVRLRRAEYFRDQSRWDEALAECDKAATLDVQRGPSLSGLARAGVLAARGETDSSTEKADAILKQGAAGDGQILYQAACVWSLASRSAAAAGDPSKAKTLADRASALLAQALTVGFHSLNYQEHNRIADDPALAPILERPDVKRLLSRRP